MDPAVIRKFVLDYLSSRPDAADSLRGIAEVWIKRQLVEVELHNVKKVLESLVAEGILAFTYQDGENDIYALSRNNRE